MLPSICFHDNCCVFTGQKRTFYVDSKNEKWRNHSNLIVSGSQWRNIRLDSASTNFEMDTLYFSIMIEEKYSFFWSIFPVSKFIVTFKMSHRQTHAQNLHKHVLFSKYKFGALWWNFIRNPEIFWKLRGL